MSDNGRASGVALYDINAQNTTMVGADETTAVKWLSDSHHVVYFTKNHRELVVLDTATRKWTVVDVRLPGPFVDTERSRSAATAAPSITARRARSLISGSWSAR